MPLPPVNLPNSSAADVIFGQLKALEFGLIQPAELLRHTQNVTSAMLILRQISPNAVPNSACFSADAISSSVKPDFSSLCFNGPVLRWRGQVRPLDASG